MISFSALPKEVILQVVEKFVLQLEAQLMDRNVQIELTPEAAEWLADKGYDDKMGARPLGRVIQEHIKKPLAEELLFGKLAKGGIVQVTVQNDEIALKIEPAGGAADHREEAAAADRRVARDLAQGCAGPEGPAHSCYRRSCSLCRAPVMEAEIGELVRRTEEATTAFMNGDMVRYLALTGHAPGFSLMNPFGGEATRYERSAGEPDWRPPASSSRARRMVELVRAEASGDLPGARDDRAAARRGRRPAGPGLVAPRHAGLPPRERRVAACASARGSARPSHRPRAGSRARPRLSGRGQIARISAFSRTRITWFEVGAA